MISDGPEWARSLATLVGSRIKELRSLRGLSAQTLADRTASLGYEVKRSVIAEMENGKRATLPIADLLVLARALSVPPVVLLLPLGGSQDVEILPALKLSAWDSFDWLTGEGEISEVPAWVASIDENEREHSVWQGAVHLLRLKAEYERVERNQKACEFKAEIYSERVSSAPTPEQAEATRELMLRETAAAAAAAGELVSLVREFARLGVEWPPASTSVSHRSPRITFDA